MNRSRRRLSFTHSSYRGAGPADFFGRRKPLHLALVVSLDRWCENLAALQILAHLHAAIGGISDNLLDFNFRTLFTVLHYLLSTFSIRLIAR